MRYCVSGALTAGEAESLSGTVGYIDLDDDRLAGLISSVRAVAAIDLSAPSYARVEERVQGHPWHTDEGNKHGGTRGWCRWTAGILLTDPALFEGGGLSFRDLGPIFHYLDLWIWSAAGTEHFVASNSGGRKVLIMFFRGGADGS